MLKHLSIRNYILIRELEMDFQRGFTTITGETGAGKSIFLGALGLLLGERADSASLSDPAVKCVVEGIFDITDIVSADFFVENELEYDSNCIIRREVLPGGKSRAFVNDTPVNLNVLKNLSEKLVDIHSQHSTILLTRQSFHLSLLDAAARTNVNYRIYLEKWSVYKHILAAIDELKTQQSHREKEKDYLSFLLHEIEELNTFPEENEQLESELLLLQNAEKIKSSLLAASSLLKYDEHNISTLLTQTIAHLSSVGNVYPNSEGYARRLKSSEIEIDDIGSELAQLAEKIQYDSSAVARIDERLSIIRRLLQKHKLSSGDELLQMKDDLALRLSEIGQSEDQISEMEQQATQMLVELTAFAENISTERTKVIPQIEKEIDGILHTLSMPYGRFKILNDKSNTITNRGLDNISFHFTANKGESPQELSKVASGGELSRLMLALKSVIARTILLPTLIFDEIDSGISGEAAHKMAGILAEMGKHIQLIVITHLPQIASKASCHMLVSKMETDHSSFTTMKQLDTNSRITEIAKMLGGDQFTETAYKTAEEMLNN
jgi:DNA repair protein RecN (Recombination protein N)